MSKKKKQKITHHQPSTINHKIVNICDKIIEYGIYAIVFFVPLVFCKVSNDWFQLPKLTFFQFLVLLILSTWLIKNFYNKEIKIIKSIFLIPVFLIIIIHVAATIISISPQTSVIGFYGPPEGLTTSFTCFLAYFIISNNITKKKHVTYIITISILSTLIVAIYGIFQHFGIELFFKDASISGQQRSYSLIGNPVFLGSYLAIVSPLVFVYLFNATSSYHKFFAIISIILLFLCLIFTYSRGAYIAFLGSILIMLFLTKNYIVKNLKYLLLIGISSCLVILIFGKQKVEVREEEKVDLFERASSMMEVKKDPSIRLRIETWKKSLYIIKDNIMLGSGLDTFWIIALSYWTPTPENSPTAVGPINKAHNEFIQVATTTGVLGLFAYLFLLIVFFKKSFYLLKVIGEEYIILVGLISGMIAYLIQAQFAPSVIPISLLFWMYVGLVDVMIRKDEKKNFLSVNKETKQNKNKDSKTWKFLLISLFTIIGSIIIIIPLVADVYYKKGKEFKNRKEFKQAISYLEKATKINPLVPLYHFDLGDCYVETKNWEKAENEWQKVININPNEPGAYTNLAYVYEQKGEYDKAILKYEKAREILNKLTDKHCLVPYHLRLLYRLGLLYISKNNFQKAISLFKEIIELDPKHFRALTNLGNLYWEKGNIDKAIIYYKKALEIAPNSALIHYNLAGAYQDKKMINEAIEEYKKVIELDDGEIKKLAKDALESLKKQYTGTKK